MMTFLSELVKKTPRRAYVHAAISFILFVIFFDFFTHGYVMDGEYDRRDNVVPYYLVFLRSVQGFEIPQWNPYLFCGTTLFTSSGYAFFYPPNWILWLFPESSLPFLSTAVLALHFYFAGYFGYLLIKEVVRDEFWALCGTVAYLLSTASMMSLFSSTEQFSVFVYLPLLAYLILTFDERSPVANGVVLTISYALLMLIAQPQFLVYALGFISAFIVFRSIADDGLTGRLLWINAASVLFAAMISAVRNLPFLIHAGGAAYLQTSYEEFLHTNTTPPFALAKLFLAEFFPFLNKGEYFNSYAGVFFAFLGLFALVFLWERKTAFWKVMAVLITLMVVGTPLAYLHYVLTGKSNLAFGRMATLIPLCFSVLGCYAGKRIMEEEKLLRRITWFSLGALIFMSLWAVTYLRGVFFPGGPDAQARSAMLFSLSHFLFFAAALVGLLIFLRVSTARRKTVIFQTLFLVLLLADLLIVAKQDINSQNPSFSPGPFYRNAPHEQGIANDFHGAGRQYRIIGFGDGTTHNRGINLGLYNSSGFESAPPPYIHRLYGYPYEVPRDKARHIRPMNERVAVLTSTRFILDIDAVYELPASLPRYSLYYDYRVVRNDDEALSRLVVGDEGIDIGKTVLLHDQPAVPVSGPGNPGTVSVIQEGHNTLLFRVESDRNALLLLNDTYDKGWSADIDGVRTAVIRANYAFRAVAVPEGAHRVRFSFSGRGFAAGLLISALSAAACVVIAAGFVLGRVREHASDAAAHRR